MLPPPARRRAGMPYLQPRNTPFALMFIVRSQTSSSVDTASSSRLSMMPALLNSTFRWPNVCFGRRDHPLAVLGARRRRPCTDTARPPAGLDRPRPCRCPALSSTSTATTAAPSAANSSADFPADAAAGARDQRHFALEPSRHDRSDPFEVSPALPVGDRHAEGGSSVRKKCA